jgi:hypothetical protein
VVEVEVRVGESRETKEEAWRLCVETRRGADLVIVRNFSIGGDPHAVLKEGATMASPECPSKVFVVSFNVERGRVDEDGKVLRNIWRRSHLPRWTRGAPVVGNGGVCGIALSEFSNSFPGSPRALFLSLDLKPLSK